MQICLTDVPTDMDRDGLLQRVTVREGMREFSATLKLWSSSGLAAWPHIACSTEINCIRAQPENQS